jgi:hypothetical protein
MTAFRPFLNPATGEWIEISEHIHPNQEERFSTVSGEATFTVDGERRTGTAGESVIVPRGVSHSEGQLGSGVVDQVSLYRPGLLAGSQTCGRICPWDVREASSFEMSGYVACGVWMPLRASRSDSS